MKEPIEKMARDYIPFNQPHLTGKELEYISEAHNKNQLAGNGEFSKKCHHWLEQTTNCQKALLTHSCTAALEISALLLDIQPGDEVIMPSYTFVSTANAFVLRGAIPIFVDIRADTMNIDESLIEEAISDKTRCIVPVHYAGVSCDMDAITRIANKHNISVVEDAAQGIMSKYKGKALGSLGDIGCLSFHETKNIISGEGGALLVNKTEFADPAEIFWEKGTNRSQFFRGQVDKYTWQSVGSSYLPGEIVAAFLYAQLNEAKQITMVRIEIWEHYYSLLEDAEAEALLRRPVIPDECQHNAHMFYVILNEKINRNNVLKKLNDNGINAVFHYVPLHTSPFGLKCGKTVNALKNTDSLSSRLIRLPLWVGLTKKQVEHITHSLVEICKDELKNPI